MWSWSQLSSKIQLKLALRQEVEDEAGSVVILEQVVTLSQGVGEEACGVGLEQVLARRQPSVNFFIFMFKLMGVD